ncbi:TIGR03032 family protein [Candidatus Venteria ishoeyi]|uniref:TIGR03032 family protein n=1 Tax=Candidatus Venteria ishoeyi TaxID=1899563 RepID=UPI0025A563D7|nr:TIGR03032 family protein [Candidatus Venteria ishoeyi]MDM8544997.1 TIGR03032 family protein [Candidatus Venteria ishoeyi]
MSSSLKIQGHSLRLRPSKAEDVEVLFRAYHNPNFLHLFATGRKPPQSLEQIRWALRKRAVIEPERLGSLEWMIIHHRHGPIGLVALHDYSESQAEYRIGLFKPCNRGLGIEATMLALDLAFNQLNLRQVYSLIYKNNLEAGEMLKRIDFLPQKQQPAQACNKQGNPVIQYTTVLTLERFRNSHKLARYGQRLTGRNITATENHTPPVFYNRRSVRRQSQATAFACNYDPEFAALISRLGCTLALSTYQAGKLILLSAQGEKLIQLPRSFNQPMGLAVSEKYLAVAQQEKVTILSNASKPASEYPHQANTYDNLLLPRTTYHTGDLDIHHIAWGKAGLWAINTRLSCLSLIDGDYNFAPCWQPPFIRRLTPHDHCHLNGLAMQGGKPCYVTALGDTDTPEGWRKNILKGGVLVDVDSGETITRGLAMPHSPRLYDKKLYLLKSAHGSLLQIDTDTGKAHELARLPGFARGMARCGDYLFIGLSKLRGKYFNDLPIAKGKLFSGVMAFHLPSAKIVGSLHYLNGCEEIYDVQVLPGLSRFGILNAQGEGFRQDLSVPEVYFWRNN